MNLLRGWFGEGGPEFSTQSKGGRPGRRWHGSWVSLLLALTAGQAGSAAGALVITPAEGVSVNGLVRGPFAPQEQVYTIQNTGTEDVTWSVGKNRPWLSLSQGGGLLAAGATAQVTVRVNSAALQLPVTNDTANVQFINLTTLDFENRAVSLEARLPGPATAEAQTVVASGRVAITLTGEPGSTYVLEEAGEVTGPFEGVVTNDFVEATATVEVLTDQPARYYRAVSSGAGAVAADLSLGTVQQVDNLLVEVSGEVNGVYVVEASTNAQDWVAICTNRVPASGSFLFTNTVFGVEETLSYRALPAEALNLTTLYHVLIVGESVALGFDGDPALSRTSTGRNYRFRSEAGNVTFAPLVEVSRETIASGAANLVVAQAPLHEVMISNIGQPGKGYDDQKKGTPVYTLGLAQFEDGPQEAAFHLFRYLPTAVFVLGGEYDQMNPAFASNIRQWQADYEKDIKYLTGFTGFIPMLHSQISAWTSVDGGAFETVLAPFALLEESVANPTKTILVGPRYFLPHAVDGAQFPGLHPTNEGYRWLGEYYGKVYKQVVVDGGSWTPLRPATITRAGTVITAVFDVPVPPLVLDTDLVTDPGHYGFEFDDGSGAPPAIGSVSLTGPDTVEIQLTGEPTGGQERLRYAYRGVPTQPGGPQTGPRGNLRDSDATASLHGNSLYNWCVHFDAPVN